MSESHEEWKARKEVGRQRRRELIQRTLSEDYPGLDYLGLHNVLNARSLWYRALWFSIALVCLLVGLFTIYRLIREYSEKPTATSIRVKSVERLKLPQLTVCPTHAATLNLDKLEAELFRNSQNGDVGNYGQEDVLNFAYFMLAGSGFQKMNGSRLDKEQLDKMNRFYAIFSRGQSVEEFFDQFFNSFGLDCHQFFQDCQLGDSKLDCCKIFEPVYLIRRGRCFRSIPLYQENFDELGKLRVQLMHPREMDAKMSTQQEIIAFIAEHKPQIAPFPRFYLYPDIWTKMRLTAKHVRLLPAEEVCSDAYKDTGKDFCYVERWLHTFLEAPLNCTYPYMHKIRPTQLRSCEPGIIYRNYANAVETANYTMQSCILPCDRWEYTVSMEKIDTTSVYRGVNLSFDYRIDLSYNDLQFELIEEVITVTFAGLIAQIGGQMSLFMGASILTLIHALIMALIIGHRMVRARQKQKQQIGAMESDGQVQNESQVEAGPDGWHWRNGEEGKPDGGIPIPMARKKPSKLALGPGREAARVGGGGIGL